MYMRTLALMLDAMPRSRACNGSWKSIMITKPSPPSSHGMNHRIGGLPVTPLTTTSLHHLYHSFMFWNGLHPAWGGTAAHPMGPSEESHRHVGHGLAALLCPGTPIQLHLWSWSALRIHIWTM